MGSRREIGPFPSHRDRLAMKMVHPQPNFDFGALKPIPGSTEQEESEMQCQVWGEFGKPKADQPCSTFYVTPFQLLNNYANTSNDSNKAREENVNHGRTLSTEEIMRVAGEIFVQFSAQRIGYFSCTSIMHPRSFSLFGEQTKDIELAQLLLSAAEKVSEREFDRANRLLLRCEWMASDTGNPVQRIVYYFAKALRERIDRETGRFGAGGGGGEERSGLGIGGKSLLLEASPAFLAHHKQIPFMPAIQFAGMQAIFESVSHAIKVHLIDLQIRSGHHLTILMQALTERHKFPIKLLKVTAVGTRNKQDIEVTGKRLASFAESLNLPFSFEVVFLSDLKDIKAELIHVQADETLAVYSPVVLRSMISRPDCLEILMKVIKSLQPAIMVVSEIEADHNSPSFAKRFIEALFFHSACFDCFEACMARDNRSRMVLEGIYFQDAIRNMVAAVDGEERISRSVTINVWRAFFARFGMVEIELSRQSLYQARFLVNQFACRSSCTLNVNGKCLIVGWKGTPLHSLSIWKFS